MRPTTTNLDELSCGGKFTWGQMLEIINIGSETSMVAGPNVSPKYSIGRFHPWKRNGSQIVTGTPDESVIEFHTWLDGKDCCESFHTFDEALAGCIAYKHEGPNHRADVYFMRMLKKGVSE